MGVSYQRGTPVNDAGPPQGWNCPWSGERMGRLGQDKPAFGWELEPLPLWVG